MKERRRVGEPNVELEYITTRQAAKLLMMSPKTLIRWSNAGRIPHVVTLGGHRRFSRREIERIAKELGQGG